jgi:hypothetical protein
MPITDYSFQDRIFFAKESGVISASDATEWANRLVEHAKQSPQPIVAVVDALEVTRMVVQAYDIFSKASFTPNVLAVVVTTNTVMSVSSKAIGLLGKRNQTVVFPTLDAARKHAQDLLEAQTKKKS